MHEQNSKSLLFIILTVIITAVVVSGGMYWWQTSVENNTPDPVLSETKNETPASVSVKMPSFNHPAEWQVVSMTDIDFIEPYKDAAKETFGTNVLGYRSTEINFNRPHDFGPYGRTVDIQIQDFVFEAPPATAEEYIKKLEGAWGLQGEKENYTSPAELDFTVWLGQSPVYEADMVLYVTQYTDAEGQKHFVEISRMGSGQEAIKAALKPVADSLEF